MSDHTVFVGESPDEPLPAFATLCRRALTRLGDEIPALAGIALFMYSVFVRSHFFRGSFGPYDEGILLTNAYFILRGLVPYRDFYADYAPGIFWLLAAIWKIFGISAWSVRLLALAPHLAIPATAGRLAGRMVGRRFSFLGLGLVSVWLLELDLIPFAWLFGLLCALVFIELLLRARDRGGWHRYALAGLALGSLGCLRYELFGYFVVICTITCVLTALFFTLRGSFTHLRVNWRSFSFLLLGAAIPISIVWLPTFALAGGFVLRDLVFDLSRYIVPARILPMPVLLALDPTTHLPVFFLQDFEGAVAVTLAGPGLCLLLLLARRPLRIRDCSAVVLVGLLSIVVLPQMMTRTDLPHALFTVAPALILVTALLESMTRHARSFSTRAWAVVLISLTVLPVWGSFWPRRSLMTDPMPGSPALSCSRRSGFYEADEGKASERRNVIDFVEKNTARTDRVFFGNTNHEWVMANEIDLYFLADRLPGVRYTQYEPNMVTRREIQDEMIASLEKYHVRLAVLSNRFPGHEDQYAMMPGSKRLDEYMASEFKPVATYGGYQILLRRK